jgi:hypothetical protein
LTVGSGGVEYENRVLATIKPQIKKLSNFSIKEGSTTAAFSANEPDLQLVAFGKIINIEIKQNAKAQMGGGSFNYDMKKKKYSLSAKTKIDEVVEEKILDALNKKRSDLNTLLEYVKDNDVNSLAQDVTGLPLRATKDMWEELTKKRLLVPLNEKVETDINFLYDHYEHKKCFYIQVGGAGFFYLKQNPLKLPIPQLTTTFVIELRLGRAGSKYVANIKKNVASGNIRAQGRMGGRNISSPYSLDKSGDFTALFGNLSKTQIESAFR